MQDVYKYCKFAQWIYDHKRNTDKIHAEDGFMVALRYNIQIQANAFAHMVTNPDSSLLVADISVMRPKVQQSCYATAWRFNQIKFGDINPYAKGESREDWDLTTAMKKSKKTAASTTKATTSSKTQASAKGKQPAATAAPRSSNYKGSNYDPNYSNR
ncbi:hypothetical protein PCANC_10926 [Puccinia coronata f. sp. avenae]|uniref:Uncharacterized protein n=1 Tax=Puccinia coronata f. sp. avenae TaxID=200324 RepID=A0A2N5SZY2_9BASI|nr:hypothetical protein PCANC_10926 [Puccinia coronata f. sp. avenae]